MEIAQRARISRNYLSELERGRYRGRVPYRTLQALADALDLDLAELVRLAGYPTASWANGQRPDMATFILTEPTLTPENRALLLRLYEALRRD